MDIKAYYEVSIKRNDVDNIYSLLICECENNAQPVVFFNRELRDPSSNVWNIKYSGFPSEVISQNGFKSPLQRFINMDRFHHYCQNGYFSSQYCSFQQIKKEKDTWMATHMEAQHDDFSSLVKCLNFEKYRNSEIWLNSRPIINLTLYYPVLILKGDLFIALLINNQLTLKKTDHVQFQKNYFSSKTTLDESNCYHIDVIKEGFLSSYLNMVKKEISIIQKKLVERKNDIDITIKYVVSEKRKRIEQLASESSTCPPKFPREFK